MLLQHLLHITDDLRDTAEIFIAQTDFLIDPTVIHPPWILNRRCRKQCVGNEQRTLIKRANACVIPANPLHRAFEARHLDPVTLCKRTVEEQHQTGEKVLGDLLRAKADPDARTAENRPHSCRRHTEGHHDRCKCDQNNHNAVNTIEQRYHHRPLPLVLNLPHQPAIECGGMEKLQAAHDESTANHDQHDRGGQSRHIALRESRQIVGKQTEDPADEQRQPEPKHQRTSHRADHRRPRGCPPALEQTQQQPEQKQHHGAAQQTLRRLQKLGVLEQFSPVQTFHSGSDSANLL